MDYITLTGISALGTHGVLDFEHKEPQQFVVDAVLYVDLSDASRSDDLADTVSYAQIADRIVSIIQGEHCDLIERLAQRIADSILLSWRVKKTIVTVHKPHAPIDHDFADVSVTIERMQSDYEEEQGAQSRKPSAASLYTAQQRETLHAENSEEFGNSEGNTSRQKHSLYKVVLALGGNIGDVEQTMRSAIVSLDSLPGNQVTGISALYSTKPWGVDQDMPDFKNAVVEITTQMEPLQLLHAIQMIEAAHGRTRQVHWGSRPLDIDIIDFDGQVSDDPELTLPHPRAWQRAFVLKPWMDINPDAQIVTTDNRRGGRVCELLDKAPDRDFVELISAQWILGGM
ncbi:2-amino-4-hydroxy-6-hydroxymethyldihydropteridine diphosphokinase [Alloscardovia theropitheci]|uniref:Bifunctional folate synthesis protein n=1 Tax=Alloscardovia theropitheci TaxID=2496842 RepID=A0A4R0QXB3_9BIFI|nr:2-amino-4-hydroxy-6-hydroxymethyldihydropteridine diphosphokinase [Alloscardovia theropitheci]TCD54051.1 2-amino-4-hydroxy-6-hydroxymethyldihydropteridine diphosphokinase [Alloscardovia theropitheci]